MTDPWAEFVTAAEGVETAGYFERAPGRGGAGAAHWFAGPASVTTLQRTTDPTELSRECGRFLDRHPRGGVLGYLGFDAVGLFEPALARFPAGSPFPLGELALVERLQGRRVRPTPRARVGRTPHDSPLADSMPRARFEGGVRRLVRDIRDGEAFQVVLSHRRAWRRPDDLIRRAGRLRSSERYAYFHYLRFGDRELVGATPESVVEMRGGSGYLNPIAGTIPAGGRRGRLPLPRDPKELAEHRMLVDLARNDLGRVARPGSVRLLRSERYERYARLSHLVSVVGARLSARVGPWELLAATFPAGTVSGAPKIRATELLRREEGTWRGPYAGAVGLVSRGGRADWALLIRSGFAAQRRLYTAAGAGIVHRSQPAREFDETLAKLDQVESVLVGSAP